MPGGRRTPPWASDRRPVRRRTRPQGRPRVCDDARVTIVTVGDAPDRDAVVRLYGITAADLDERDTIDPPAGRWLACDQDGAAVGMATAAVRPDDRLVVVHRLVDGLDGKAAFAPLLDAAVRDLGRTMHVVVDRTAVDRLLASRALGFAADSESTSFDVPFAPALAWAERARRHTRFDLVPADRVDPDGLFELDTVLRQDVPGCDGWRGNRAWFDDELSSAEFDPAAYLVAQDPDTRAVVGLIRFWRNERGPALGLLGVRRRHRSGRVAVALLTEGLRAASCWGSKTFTTHTARPALQRHLRRVDATETGGFVRLTWSP